MFETLAEKVAEITKPKSEDATVQDTEVSSKDTIRELKESYYANKDIKDFTDFKTHAIYPSSGEFIFQVEAKYLKYAVGVLKNTSGGSKLTDNLIKITLFKNQIKLSGFNQSSFSETFIPLSNQMSIQEPIFFIFDYSTLAKITNSFDKLNLTFTYKADKQLLCMRSGSTLLELTTSPEEDFTKFATKIKDITEVPCKFPLLVIQHALSYLSMFAKKDDKQPAFNMVEIKENNFVAGSGSNIGLYNSDYLSGNPLKLNFESMQICSKVLPYFHSKITLFESDTYYIIRDQNVYVGFEKVKMSFPSIKPILALKHGDSYNIPRETFLKALIKLSVVSDKESYLKFKVCGNGKDATLKISVKGKDSRISKDSMQIDRKEDCETRAYLLPLDLVAKIVSFFKTPEISVFEAKDRAVYFRDIGDYFSTTSVLSPIKIT